MIELKKIDIYLINALSKKDVEATLTSFYSSIAEDPESIKINIVEEQEYREQTLNYILSIRDKRKDILIFVDDILFTPDWYEALKRNYQNGSIIGYTMLKPGTNIVQNNGYDLVMINNEITYEGKDKGQQYTSSKFPEWRECDTITGCMMYIKNEVLTLVPEFPQEGLNRVGEVIFTLLAKKTGQKTIVLSHPLYHGGISTKQSKDIKLSSLSWSSEKQIWDAAIKKYLPELRPTTVYTTSLTPQLLNTIEKVDKCLIYGCGTVSAALIESINRDDYCVSSGLVDEIQTQFYGKEVLDIRETDIENYDIIIITAIGYETDVINSYFHSDYQRHSKKYIRLSRQISGNDIIIDLQDSNED